MADARRNRRSFAALARSIGWLVLALAIGSLATSGLGSHKVCLDGLVHADPGASVGGDGESTRQPAADATRAATGRRATDPSASARLGAGACHDLLVATWADRPSRDRTPPVSAAAAGSVPAAPAPSTVAFAAAPLARAPTAFAVSRRPSVVLQV